MEEAEFQRLLHLFPVVRSRNYCGQSESLVESPSHATKDEVMDWENPCNDMDERDDIQYVDSEDPFWQKLRLAAERKVGPTEARHFCEALRKTHKKLVYEKLSLDSARKFLDAVQK